MSDWRPYLVPNLSSTRLSIGSKTSTTVTYIEGEKMEYHPDESLEKGVGFGDTNEADAQGHLLLVELVSVRSMEATYGGQDHGADV